MTCLDCSTTFPNPASWKGHTSCMTEAEKFEKSVYKPPKDKQKKASDAAIATKAPQSALSSTAPVPGSSLSVPTKEVESQPQPPSSEKSTKKPKKSKEETKSKASETLLHKIPGPQSILNSALNRACEKVENEKRKENLLKEKKMINDKKRKYENEEKILEETNLNQSVVMEEEENNHHQKVELNEEVPKKKKKKKQKNKESDLINNKTSMADLPKNEEKKIDDHNPLVITMNQVSNAARNLIMASQAPISIQELIDSVTSFIQSQQTRPCDIVLRDDIARMLCDGAVKFFSDKQAGSVDSISLNWF